MAAGGASPRVSPQSSPKVTKCCTRQLTASTLPIFGVWLQFRERKLRQSMEMSDGGTSISSSSHQGPQIPARAVTPQSMGLVPRGEPGWDPRGRRPPQVPRPPRQQHPNSPVHPQTHQAPGASTLGVCHPASPQRSLPSPCPALQGAPGAPARDKPAEHPLCNPKAGWWGPIVYQGSSQAAPSHPRGAV